MEKIIEKLTENITELNNKIERLEIKMIEISGILNGIKQTMTEYKLKPFKKNKEFIKEITKKPDIKPEKKKENTPSDYLNKLLDQLEEKEEKEKQQKITKIKDELQKLEKLKEIEENE